MERMTSELQTALPTGTITFLFTDIEGSVPLWEREPAATQAAVARHHAIPHTAAAAPLPPDVIAAAQERGRARDVETTVAQVLAELEEQDPGDGSP